MTFDFFGDVAVDLIVSSEVVAAPFFFLLLDVVVLPFLLAPDLALDVEATLAAVLEAAPPRLFFDFGSST